LSIQFANRLFKIGLWRWKEQIAEDGGAA